MPLLDRLSIPTSPPGARAPDVLLYTSFTVGFAALLLDSLLLAVIWFRLWRRRGFSWADWGPLTPLHWMREYHDYCQAEHRSLWLYRLARFFLWLGIAGMATFVVVCLYQWSRQAARQPVRLPSVVDQVMEGFSGGL